VRRLRPRATGTLAIALCLVVATGGIGAARVPDAREALCLPILMTCGTPAPTPAPSPSQPPPGVPGLPGLPGLPPVLPPVAGLPGVPGVTPAPTASGVPLIALADPNAPTFTLPAAQLGGSSISFSGLRSIGFVTVPLADGTRAPVIKLVADDIVITDFLLDVRRATGPSLVTNSGRMELRGNVQVYLDSISASLLDGTALTLGAATPPTAQELPPTLLRPTLGLVGVTANSITLIPSKQVIHE
jgi:hypothetical protein